MKKKLLALAIAGLATTNAFATDFEVAIGGTKFDSSNGVFYYNEIAGNDIDTRSPSFQLAVANTFYGQRFRTGYQYFGHVTEATSIYPHGDGNCHKGQCNCGTKQEWYGEGTYQAIFFQWEPSYQMGDWRFFADIGPMLVRSRFQQKWVAGYANYTIDSPNDDRWKWTGFSVGVEYKNMSLIYQHQPISSSAETGFVTKADSVYLRARF